MSVYKLRKKQGKSTSIRVVGSDFLLETRDKGKQKMHHGLNTGTVFVVSPHLTSFQRYELLIGIHMKNTDFRLWTKNLALYVQLYITFLSNPMAIYFEDKTLFRG